MDPCTKPKKLAPDIHIPICPPRTGVDAASGVKELSVEDAEVLEVWIGVAARARSTGRGRLQTNELAAAV
jgi:hypothetical protein